MKSTILSTLLAVLTATSPLSILVLPTLAQTDGINIPRPQQLSAKANDITTGSASKGYFFTNDWEIKVSRNGNNYGNGTSYIYAGRNSKTRDSISLAGGRLTRSEGKHFYKWRNGSTIYLVTWQPEDPNSARVQIFNPGGKEIFNKLMDAMID
jgi:hypothetical protein